jgi:hypothetical protein
MIRLSETATLTAVLRTSVARQCLVPDLLVVKLLFKVIQIEVDPELKWLPYDTRKKKEFWPN